MKNNHGSEGEDRRRAEESRLGQSLPAYRVHGLLGRGAFGTVYGATHLRLGREVAIKVLAESLVNDAAARDRFATEAQLLASFDHPHVVRVHDYVEADVCALVMERMRGGTVSDVVPLRDGHAGSQALAWARDALSGLDHAHQRGILHLDVKPANLLFGDAGALKVGDFGLARVIGGSGLVRGSQRVGTPAYMAPEQISEALGPISPATDVWGAGVVLFELLAGVGPFSDCDEPVEDAILRRLTETPRDLRAALPGLPDAVAEVVMRALARRPEDRYQSAAEFAGEIERVAGLPTVSGRQEVAVGTTRQVTRENPATITVTESAGRRSRARSLRSRRGALVGIAVVIAAAGAALWIAISPAPPAPPGLPPPAGWPHRVVLGWSDQVSGMAGVGRRAGSMTLQPLNQTIGEWSRHAGRPLSRFIETAHRAGLVPYTIFYLLRALGSPSRLEDADIDQIRRALVDRGVMDRYWRDVRRYLQVVGQAHQTVAIGVEQSLWALIEQHLGFTGQNPELVHAVVGDPSLPELEGLDNDLLGFVQAWARLRDRYAPKALLGYEIGDYGTNTDIAKSLPSPSAVIAAARESAEWYLVISNNDFDFGAFDVAYGEQGQDPSSQSEWSTAKKAALVSYVHEWTRVSGRPVVLEDVPTGNSVFRAIDEHPFHWSDSWVQWLIGDSRFSGLRAARAAGVIGIAFGIGAGANETCPCDAAHDGVTNGSRRGLTATSSDDDGGYLAARATALVRAGGLALP